MPVRSYTTKADYDSDYSFKTGGPVESAPAANVTFSGNDLTFDVPWPRPLVGGHLVITVGKRHPNNRSWVEITAVNGNTITVNGPAFQSETVANPKIRYWTRRVPMFYDAPIIRPQMHVFIERLVTQVLNIPTTESIVMVGTGLGWEVERLLQLGYDVMGVDSSPWVQNNKASDHTPELRQRLLDVGFDPDVGEGANILAQWTAKPRTEVPDRILNEDLLTNGSRNRVKNALNKKQADWGIGVGVLPVLDDQEITNLDREAAKLIPNRVYYQDMSVTVVEAGFIWRTRAQLEALVQPDTILVGPEAPEVP